MHQYARTRARVLVKKRWHWAFLPTIVAEALPGADLFPTWTAALLFVSRDRLRSDESEVLLGPGV